MKNDGRAVIIGNSTDDPASLLGSRMAGGTAVVVAVDGVGVMWTRSADATLPAPAAPTPGAPLTFFDTPAAATAPDADTPAQGAGTINVLDTLTVSLNAVAAQGVLTVVVRDGATGAGAILYSFFIGPLAAGTSMVVQLTDLNIRGTADTELTVETTAAPAATNFCSIACTGHIAAA
jgi:hypothetical protein